VLLTLMHLETMLVPRGYGRILAALRRHASPLIAKRVVAIGIHPGFARALRHLGIEADGLEHEPGMLSWAASQDVPVIFGNLLAPPQRIVHRPYDITFSHDLLDALASEARVMSGKTMTDPAHRALQQLAKLTKPGGLSIHWVSTEFPWTRADLEAEGFELIDGSIPQRFLVLRRLEQKSVTTSHPTRTPTQAHSNTPG
jgi:hypothetical protein